MQLASSAIIPSMRSPGSRSGRTQTWVASRLSSRCWLSWVKAATRLGAERLRAGPWWGCSVPRPTSMETAQPCSTTARHAEAEASSDTWGPSVSSSGSSLGEGVSSASRSSATSRR
jgi:hypothetical protein